LRYTVEQIRDWIKDGQAVSGHVVIEVIEEYQKQNQMLEALKNRACWCVIKKAMHDQHTVACLKVQEFMNQDR
jgi:hypothetical protein